MPRFLRPLPDALRRSGPLTRAQRRLLAGPAIVMAVGLLAFSLFFAMGGTSSASPSAATSSPEEVAAGQQLFNLHCASCHGVNGVGTQLAPNLIYEGAAGADFYLSTGRMPLNNPHDEAVQNHPYFTPGQIRQLDAFVAALPQINHLSGSGTPIPQVLPVCSQPDAANSSSVAAAEDNGTSHCVTLSFGQQTYSLNCAQCHQIAGRGGLLSKGNVVPTLQNANLTQTAEAMRVGPMPMPKFGPGQFSEVQLSAVAQYVRYLQHPQHPGGLTISGFGPVAEGFVGIIAGLGLLLLVSRLMGTRG